MFTKIGKIEPFDKKVYLSSPTMHGIEMDYIVDAYKRNWVSTVGENIEELERVAAQNSGVKYATALSNGTAALHLCVKLAAERLYGKSTIGQGSLNGKKVFCSDITFVATVNPIIYEGGEPIFIDTEADSWNMSPKALEKAFQIYPDVKLVVYAELYGFPGNIELIREICDKYGALLIEDAAESLGAKFKGKECGSFGNYGAISYNGNKIITGSSGGCLLTNHLADANKVKKWSTQAREDSAWYEHEEIGYNYRMSNIIAGIVRGQYHYLQEHIDNKKKIYYRYKEAFKDLPISMIPYDSTIATPNYWLSAILIDQDKMCQQVRDDRHALYIPESGKSCPTEIMEALTSINAESRPIWKPMHMQPIFRMNSFITIDGEARAQTNAYIDTESGNVSQDIFTRGLCLPSDNKMTEVEQDKIISVIKKCFE